MKRNVMSALEDIEPSSKGESVKAMETELVLYAKVNEPTMLDQCSDKERHVQVEGTFSTGVRCRVRHINKGGEDTYEFTYKLKSETKEGGNNVEACVEHTVAVDKPFFDDFLKVAERVITKTRFIFNSQRISMKLNKDSEDAEVIEIPNVQFEVDVFDNQPQEELWCKIDLEVDNILNFLKTNYPQVKDIKLVATVTTLPFKPDNILLGHSQDDKVKDKISELWKYFAKPLNSVE